MDFKEHRLDGIRTISIIGCPNVRAIEINSCLHIQNYIDGNWIYSSSAPNFKSIQSAKNWMSDNIDIITDDDFEFIRAMYGLSGGDLHIIRKYDGSVDILKSDKVLSNVYTSDDLVRKLDKLTDRSIDIMLCYREYRNNVIECAISSRDLTKNMVRVKSSNVWAYNINIKNRNDKFGDVIVQFKDSKGGPGDIYMYFDVPVMVYRRWHTATSKGHYFWQYIRNNFQYRKLTGDKRGKLKNAVN